MRMLIWTASLFMTIGLALGQPVDKTLTFDVVSIKLAPPMVPGMVSGGSSGGPGSKDPGRIRYPNGPLINLITTAYDIKPYQFVGPSWISTERFDIEATMPPETTRDQFRFMLQNLLADRFKVVIHREKKELPLYSLIVAKAGPKMKESSEGADQDVHQAERGPLKMGPDGFPILPPSTSRGITMMRRPFGERISAHQQTMLDLAIFLSGILSKSVTDETTLTAKYDFTLTYSMEGLTGGMGIGPSRAEMPENAEPLQTLFAAIQSQLGLRLEPKKGPVEILIVDHAEKTPTEN